MSFRCLQGLATEGPGRQQINPERDQGITFLKWMEAAEGGLGMITLSSIAVMAVRGYNAAPSWGASVPS